MLALSIGLIISKGGERRSTVLLLKSFLAAEVKHNK